MSFRDFVDSIFGGGDSSSNRIDAADFVGGKRTYSDRAPTRSVRPQYRPETYTVPSGGGGGDDGNDDTRTIPFADAKPVTFQQAGIEIPEDKDLNYDNVPYFSGPSIRPKNMVFKDGVYVPLPEGQRPGLFDLLGRVRPDALTDIRLGLGSLGKDPRKGFRNTLESMGFTGLDDSIYDEAYKNFKDRSETTSKNLDGGNNDDPNNFYDNYDPCPEGYRTDPVTGMCVPVMDAAYDTAPAQVQDSFVSDPFPTIASGGGITSPVVTSMNYTQPMDYTRPAISPPVPQGIAGIPLTPIMG